MMSTLADAERRLKDEVESKAAELIKNGVGPYAARKTAMDIILEERRRKAAQSSRLS